MNLLTARYSKARPVLISKKISQRRHFFSSTGHRHINLHRRTFCGMLGATSVMLAEEVTGITTSLILRSGLAAVFVLVTKS
jgi:hypothetical protein